MKTKYFYPILFALLFSSFVSKAQDTGMYLYYPGVTTGAGTGAHVNESVVLAFSYGFSNSGTGSTPGTNNFQDYSLTKYNDLATGLIQTALVSGSNTDGVELRIYKLGVLIQTHKLRGARVTSFSAGGSGGELGSGCPTCTGLTENVTINFSGIQIGTFSNNFLP